jgi:hypothetical protein
LELVEIVKVGAAIQGRKRPTLGGEKFNLVSEEIYRRERRGIGHGRTRIMRMFADFALQEEAEGTERKD